MDKWNLPDKAQFDLEHSVVKKDTMTLRVELKENPSSGELSFQDNLEFNIEACNLVRGQDEWELVFDCYIVVAGLFCLPGF